LENDREGLNSGFKTTILLDCLPMGGLGSSYSSKKEYEQPPERGAKLW